MAFCLSGSAAEAGSGILSVTGMTCSGLDQFSYGEVTVTGSTLTIAPKGIDGNPLVTDDGVCGPLVLHAEP